MAERRLKAQAPPTAIGAMVMAIGIFILAALQQLPGPIVALTRILGYALVLIWIAIALSFFVSYLRGTFRLHGDSPMQSFGIGTWVAGTAVLGEVTLATLPARPIIATVLTAITVILWVWFLTLVLHGLRAIIADPARQGVTGSVLLSTVTTQALVILGQKVLPGEIPHRVSDLLIVVGYLFYALGLTLLVQRYLRGQGWRLSDEWDNTNCIMHGAMSITGLAAILSGAIPDGWIVLTWLWTAGMFAIIEGIEIGRLAARVRSYGWRRGVFTYHVSQWARNFTFGMFYACTWALYKAHVDAHTLPQLDPLWALLVAWGQYAVLALLVVEAILFLARYAPTLTHPSYPSGRKPLLPSGQDTTPLPPRRERG